MRCILMKRQNERSEQISKKVEAHLSNHYSKLLLVDFKHNRKLEEILSSSIILLRYALTNGQNITRYQTEILRRGGSAIVIPCDTDHYVSINLDLVRKDFSFSHLFQSATGKCVWKGAVIDFSNASHHVDERWNVNGEELQARMSCLDVLLPLQACPREITRGRKLLVDINILSFYWNIGHDGAEEFLFEMMIDQHASLTPPLSCPARGHGPRSMMDKNDAFCFLLGTACFRNNSSCYNFPCSTPATLSNQNFELFTSSYIECSLFTTTLSFPIHISV